jgi:hypothetical protein
MSKFGLELIASLKQVAEQRTPSPPAFSSMKSTPAVSNARRIAASFAAVTDNSPSTNSVLRIVATPTLEAAVRSRAVQRNSARAARIRALDILRNSAAACLAFGAKKQVCRERHFVYVSLIV